MINHFWHKITCLKVSCFEHAIKESQVSQIIY